MRSQGTPPTGEKWRERRDPPLGRRGALRRRRESRREALAGGRERRALPPPVNVGAPRSGRLRRGLVVPVDLVKLLLEEALHGLVRVCGRWGGELKGSWFFFFLLLRQGSWGF